MVKVKLGDVAIECKQSYKGNRDNIPSVGLEHLIPGEVKLSNWDTNSDNTFTKGFKKNHILLGRRRAYLKKAVIAQFEGICSGDITVIEAIPNKINIDLLPFIIQNDRFFDYATKGSAGSLSPRVKWEYLKEYEFNLPSIEEQERLATLLWAAYDLKESYKNLITATDEMVKSQFIEMFGTPLSATQKWPIVPLKKCCEINPPRPKSNLLDSAMVSFIPMQAISEEGYIIKNEHKEYREVKKGFTYFQNDDVLFAKITPCMENGKGAIAYNLCNGVGMGSTEFHVLRPIGGLSNSHWLLHLTRLPLFRQEAERHMTGTAGQRRVPANFLSEFSIGIPPIKLQNDFKDIVIQADKSKAELQQSIDNIDKVMKSLLP